MRYVVFLFLIALGTAWMSGYLMAKAEERYPSPIELAERMK